MRTINKIASFVWALIILVYATGIQVEAHACSTLNTVDYHVSVGIDKVSCKEMSTCCPTASNRFDGFCTSGCCESAKTSLFYVLEVPVDEEGSGLDEITTKTLPWVSPSNAVNFQDACLTTTLRRGPPKALSPLPKQAFLQVFRC